VYRINYNQGQVSKTFDTHKEASREIIAQSLWASNAGQSIGSAFIQKYMGEGEWSAVGLTSKQKYPHLHKD
jgi:hypothetical protein